MEVSKQRTEYVDIAKGLAMLAVVWGHILTAGWSFVLVYTFDIPLFFFISGMMFKKEKYRTFWSFFKNRVRTLLLPYVIFSVITWGVWVAYNLAFHNNVNIWKPLLQTVIAQGSGKYMIHDIPLWFVTCLFVVEMLYYFISKCHFAVNLVISAAMAAAGYFMLYNNFIDFDFTKLPWNIEVAMSAMLFYAVGNLFVMRFKVSWVSEFTKKHKALSWLAWVVSTALMTVLGQINGHVTMGSNDLGKSVFLFYIDAFFGIISVLTFAGLAEGLKPMKCISWIGRNSFNMMAIHVPVQGFLCVILARLVHTSSDAISESMGYSGIVFIFTLAFCIPIMILINKFKGLVKKA